MYLLDTCAFIWYFESNENLSNKARELIKNMDGIFLSLASLWEIAIKKTIKKLELNKTTFELEKICDENSITIIPIVSKYFETIQKLPLIHKDPFDRLIMAVSIEERLTLITNDSNIKKYTEVNCVW